MQSKSDDTSKVLRVEWSKRLVGQSLAGGKCISIKKEIGGEGRGGEGRGGKFPPKESLENLLFPPRPCSPLIK